MKQRIAVLGHHGSEEAQQTVQHQQRRGAEYAMLTRMQCLDRPRNSIRTSSMFPTQKTAASREAENGLRDEVFWWCARQDTGPGSAGINSAGRTFHQRR